ncbi:MAG TPA: serine protease [Acidimicrobiia bacterium]|nr:serine protease [Acidimicrobiia bacterium]
MRRAAPLVAAVMLLTSACSGGDTTATTSPPTTSTDAPAATTTTDATTTPVDETPVDETPVEELTTRDLYDSVSPSLAFIETELSTGSGVLLDSGWIVTSAHVIWPFDEVRVVFPDGTAFDRVPVVRADVYEDLAVVGPVATEAPGLTLDPSVDYGVGDTVFLVGYPGEIEAFPTPAITQGVISRIRQWEGADLTFLQTDALIAGGQSGGALVARNGALLGVSGLGGFTESNFALVAAAEDLDERVAALIAGETPGRFDIHPIAGTDPSTEQEVNLASFWHEAILVATEPAGTELSIDVDESHILDLTDAVGYSLSPSEELTSSIAATTDHAEPHYVFVAATQPGPSTTTVRSSHPLAIWSDPDDDQVVEPGDTVLAVLDVSGEFDVFRIALRAGQPITVTVDGLLDAVVWIDRIGNPDEALAFDDDSGGGLYGTNAQVEFTPDQDGEYLIVVSDVLLEPGVGYTLTIE